MIFSRGLFLDQSRWSATGSQAKLLEANDPGGPAANPANVCFAAEIGVG
jgi:hypothetical protein